MAAMIASRRASAKLLEKFLFPSAARPVHRSFNTSAQMSGYGDGRSLEVVDIETVPGYCRRIGDVDLPTYCRLPGDVDLPTFFSGSFDPFLRLKQGLRQIRNLENMMERRAATRRGCEAKEDKDALYLRIDMPGLGKEHVRVSAEQNTLFIKGQGEEAGEERFSSRVDLPPELYKMDQIRAEMKNGVLKVTVPKVKEVKRKDAFNVQIE